MDKNTAQRWNGGDSWVWYSLKLSISVKLLSHTSTTSCTRKESSIISRWSQIAFTERLWCYASTHQWFTMLYCSYGCHSRESKGCQWKMHCHILWSKVNSTWHVLSSLYSWLRSCFSQKTESSQWPHSGSNFQSLSFGRPSTFSSISSSSTMSATTLPGARGSRHILE